MEDINGIDLQELLRQANANQELLAWCNQFISKSRDWRRNSWEDKWRRYQRNADSIYDPDIASKKRKWQSKNFIPMTASHRETLMASIYRTTVGPRPMLEMKARPTVPQEMDQSLNIRDIILREMEKSRFEVGYNTLLDETTTFGSGFVRIRWENKSEVRRVKKPVFAPIDPAVAQMMAEQGQMMPQPQISGYEFVMEEVQTYRGIRFEPISIWDVFPDPKALKIEGNPIAVRYRLNYGDVVKGVEQGYFLPEAIQKLDGLEDGEADDDDKLQVQSDRDQSDVEMSRTDYAKNLRCFELNARLPKKWILEQLAEGEDGEVLIPARVIFHKDVVLFKEASEEYDGEPPIVKLDYMPVSGQFYARGIPEMLQDLQEVTNEGVNQRLDANARLINPKFAAIEKGLIDPADIENAFATIRLNNKYITDVRQAFMQIDFQPLDRAAYMDPQEMERYAQERTSATKVSLGTAGQVKDANDTLGGMQLIKESTDTKLAYIGMVMEFSGLQAIFRAYWKNAYVNLDPTDVEKVLGPERAMTFQLLSPEEIENDYVYHPQGTFAQENRNQVRQAVMGMVQMFGQYPWFKMENAHDRIAQLSDIDPDDFRMSPEELQENLVSQGMMQMAQQPLQETSGPPPAA